MNVEKHLSLLGKKVEDKVTGFRGVVHHVGFDLYGCIQAIVNPGVDKDGKLRDTVWFDVSRLAVIDDVPVMKVPNYFGDDAQARGNQGSADKPMMNKA